MSLEVARKYTKKLIKRNSNMKTPVSVLSNPAIVACGGLALLAFGLYLQHVQGLTPCPMCIVQRYCLVLVSMLALAAAATKHAARKAFSLAGLVMACCGAGVAARQSFLQWFPPEMASCGRDFYGMIENYAISKAIPMIFRGSGNCSEIDWTFLGGSIANWSFISFTVLALALLVSMRKSK